MRTFLLTLLIQLAFSVNAQKTLTGKVLDADNSEPLIGANLYLLTDFSIGAVTNFDGEFAVTIPIEHLQDSILVSYVGYSEQIIAIDQIDAVIYMDPSEMQMAAVQVVAEPLISEEFKFTKVNKLEIYTNPAAKADPLLAVNSMPAATTTDESASISLRGSSPVETGIFLNNVPVYDAVRYAQLNGIGTFSLFNTSLIQKVTVFPGNPPLEFGNSTSGVVSIVTDTEALEANTNSTIISPANVGYQRNQMLGKANMKLFVNYQPSQFLKWMNPKALDRLNAFSSVDGGLYLYGNLGSKASYKVYNYLLNETYQYKFQHPSYEGNFDQDRLKGINVTNFTWESGKGTISWNQGYSFTEGRYAYSASLFDVDNRSIYQALSYFQAMEKFHVKFGLSLDGRTSEVVGTFFQYEFALGSDHPTFNLDERVEAVSLEAYTYAKYYLSDKWIAGGGLRKNLNQLNQRNYLSKQINITHLVNNNWKLIGGIGEYNKFGIYENRAEQVEIKSYQASVDVFYNRPGINASLSFFAKENEENDLQSTVLGFEFYVDKRIGKDWSMDLAYTYLSPTENSGYDLSYFIKSNLSYNPGYWTFSSNTILREGLAYTPVSGSIFQDDLNVYQPVYAEDQTRYSDYMIINLAASRLFPVDEDLTLVAFASINNATNHKNLRGYDYTFDYAERSAVLLSRRLVYFGVQINF